MPQLPSRPSPTRPSILPVVVRRLLGWLHWVGWGRAVGGSVVVLAVVAGGYWLVRPPELPTEALLPFTSTTAAAPARTTLPVGAPGPSPDDAGGVVVHVAGAVRSPGVYDLPADARAIDAVEAAGGFATDADGDAINLAARLSDGQRVYVPRIGETPPPDPAADGATADGALAGPIDLNTATAEQLESLPGIGPTTAAAIVVYRDEHGPFASVEQLAEVSGIGPSKLDAIRGLVTV